MHTTSLAPAKTAEPGLSAGELVRFREQGWVGNFPLVNAAEASSIASRRESQIARFSYPDNRGLQGGPGAFERRPWFKSMHAYLPDYFALASHPAIVGRVASILGPDLIAWGVTTILMQPGQVHRWHVDLEHTHWEGVSAFIGLQGNMTQTNLKVVTRSQRMGALPQHLGIHSDADALAACRRGDPAAALEVMDVEVGEFSLFDGRLWHGSHNTGEVPRIAMIAQYARPDARIRIPLNWDEPIRWHPDPPPCVLVRGQDRYGINRVVTAPLHLAD